MTSLPLKRKPTEIVLLLNCGENVNFQEILENATIENIPLQAIDEFHLLVNRKLSEKSTAVAEKREIEQPKQPTDLQCLTAQELNSSQSNLNSKVVLFRPRMTEKPLSQEEAEGIVSFINSHLKHLKTLPGLQKCSHHIIRRYLVLLDEGKGFERLGFQSMTTLLNSNLIQGSRSNLQKQWQAGRIEHDYLGIEPGTLPEDHCRKLAILKNYPEEIKKAYNRAQELAQNGRITGQIVQQAIQEIAQNHEIELPKPKTQKKSRCGWQQDIPSDSRTYKIDLCGVEWNLQDAHTEICTQLEKVAQECACTPENLIVQGLMKLVTKSTNWSDLEAISKAIELALVDTKTERAA